MRGVGGGEDVELEGYGGRGGKGGGELAVEFRGERC